MFDKTKVCQKLMFFVREGFPAAFLAKSADQLIEYSINSIKSMNLINYFTVGSSIIVPH